MKHIPYYDGRFGILYTYYYEIWLFMHWCKIKYMGICWFFIDYISTIKQKCVTYLLHLLLIFLWVYECGDVIFVACSELLWRKSYISFLFFYLKIFLQLFILFLLYLHFSIWSHFSLLKLYIIIALLKIILLSSYC